jgi:hypothetical protein
MLTRIAAVVAGVALAVSGLLPWTSDGLSGAYVAGLGGLLLVAGLVVAGVGVAAPKNRLARWSIFVLSVAAGLFALFAVGVAARGGVGSSLGVAFYVMIVASGLGIWASIRWVEATSHID